jgi:hypothetical protein
MYTNNTPNRLITPELVESLKDYPLYSQDNKGKDALCIARFRIGRLCWYITEGNPEGNDFTFFGIIVGFTDTEYGYFSSNEMAGVTYDASEFGLGTLRIERDTKFTPKPLCDIPDSGLQTFLSRLYDKE